MADQINFYAHHWHKPQTQDCLRINTALCLPPEYTQTPTHTHTTILRPSWILSGTTRVSQHQKGKTNLDLLEQETVIGSLSYTIKIY